MKNVILTRKFIVCGFVCFLVTQFMLFTPFASADFAEGLVLHHSYEEGEGTLTVDLSGNGHDGVIDNPEWVDGKFGKALKFGGEGSDVFVTVESSPILNVNECTFMAWINAEHWDGTRQIVGKSVHGGCSGRTQYGLFSEGGVFKLRFETESGRADISTDLPPAGEWVHIGFTNDGSTAKIYINGEAVVDGEVPGTLNANDDPWRIGQDCDRLNYVFAGLIDEVRLWNRALTAEDFAALKDLPTAVDARAKLTTTWGDIKIHP
ncbi:LamG domain-containing protein [Candidatus Poribacteria bacterium]|nr:LamG domain-containing protein [Candidatus Poribacteria bacterium]